MHGHIDYVWHVPPTKRLVSPEIPLGELEHQIQAAFATRDMVVVPEYFRRGHPLSPTNVAYVLGGYDPAHHAEPHAKTLAETSSRLVLVSGLIALDETVEAIPVVYYDKIFVSPSHGGNGIMRDMVSMARRRDSENGSPLAILRTSEPHLDVAYGRLSDSTTRVGGYFIHGFGFSALPDLFRQAAAYIAAKQATAIHPSAPRHAVYS